MGFRSTLTVNREQAISAINAKIVSATDDQLGEILLDLYGDLCLYNFAVTVTAGNYSMDNDTLQNLAESNWDD
jgi:hypothetical protein